MIRKVMVLSALLAASASFAQPSNPEIEAEYSTAYRACMDASGGVTVAMRDCSAAESERLDVKLNQQYRAALVRLPSRSARETLRRSQRVWLRNRYVHCRAAAAEEEGGTLWLIMMDDCALHTDAQRIVWLRHYRG